MCTGSQVALVSIQCVCVIFRGTRFCLLSVPLPSSCRLEADKASLQIAVLLWNNGIQSLHTIPVSPPCDMSHSKLLKGGLYGSI